MSSSTLAHMDTNDLDAFFMPFTSNRQYKKDPRLVVGAERMYFRTPDGRQVIDSSAGLWCVNAGHCHPKIVEAVRSEEQTSELQSLMRTSYAVFFLKQNTNQHT